MSKNTFHIHIMKDNPEDKCARKKKKLLDNSDSKGQQSQGKKMTNPQAQSLSQNLSISFKDNSAALKNKSSLTKWNQSNSPKRGNIDIKRHLRRKLQLLHHEIRSHILLKIEEDVRLLVCSMNRNRGASSL